MQTNTSPKSKEFISSFTRWYVAPSSLQETILHFFKDIKDLHISKDFQRENKTQFLSLWKWYSFYHLLRRTELWKQILHPRLVSSNSIAIISSFSITKELLYLHTVPHSPLLIDLIQSLYSRQNEST